VLTPRLQAFGELRDPANGSDGHASPSPALWFALGEACPDCAHRVMATTCSGRLVHNAYRLALVGPTLRNPEAAAAEPASVDPEAASSKTITKSAKGGKK
jgi:hypothetical protein